MLLLLESHGSGQQQIKVLHPPTIKPPQSDGRLSPLRSALAEYFSWLILPIQKHQPVKHITQPREGQRPLPEKAGPMIWLKIASRRGSVVQTCIATSWQIKKKKMGVL